MERWFLIFTVKNTHECTCVCEHEHTHTHAQTHRPVLYQESENSHETASEQGLEL